jgi:hypothetical protein
VSPSESSVLLLGPDRYRSEFVLFWN